jgi:hypothetical protein
VGEAGRQRIEGVMCHLGTGGTGYDREHPPYVVFDWDNTSIVNDTEEALLVFQIETFSFRIRPLSLPLCCVPEFPQGHLPRPFATWLVIRWIEMRLSRTLRMTIAS